LKKPHVIIIDKMRTSLKGIPVLFENNFCIVLNKPSGLSVQGGKGIGISLDSILSEKTQPRPLLVHRLDRDTSGLILVAKTKEAAQGFSVLFAGVEPGKPKKDKAIVKRYLGVCAGIPMRKSGKIALSLDVRGQQRKSETFFRLLSSGVVSDFSVSLLELELGTGRMHQIRRHLAQSGHPLLGDDKYGNFPLNKSLRKTTGLRNLLLHASKLLLPPVLPLLPEGLDVSAPLPEYFSRFLLASSIH
jgi:23S rRNA pseudouridine955/2504/2580 synthase